jgi:hypothetical protein
LRSLDEAGHSVCRAMDVLSIALALLAFALLLGLIEGLDRV